MATPVNTQGTIATTGNREDLSDVIYDISPWLHRAIIVVCFKCHWNVHSAINAKAVNSGKPLTDKAEGNPEPSLEGNLKEGVTTRGRACRRWEGHCAKCGKFVSKPLSDIKGKAYICCSRKCANSLNGSKASKRAALERDDIVWTAWKHAEAVIKKAALTWLMETPFASGISRVRATAVTHEWQTDSLAAAGTANAQLEGDDATADAHAATVRLSNVTQIFRKVISVSRTQRRVNSAGRADEYEYQLAKRGRELKRDIERTLLSDHGKVVPTTTATARQLAGIESWLSSNKHHFAATSTTPGAGTAMVIGNAVAVSTTTQLQPALDTVIASCWTNGGDPGVIMTSANGKRCLSKLPGIATLYRDVPAMSQGQIINGADVYVSNFGNHTIVPNRFMEPGTILVLDMEYWAIAELDGIQEVPLAKTGDSDRAMIITELTLEARNQASSGKIADASFKPDQFS